MTLNEGLEALGTDEYLHDGGMYCGVFEESVVKHVGFPSTLKRIEYSAFKNCKNLKDVQLPEQLEAIGLYAFSGSGLERVATPQSVRAIHQGAFFDCRGLKRATLNEGLEVLGTDQYLMGDKLWHGVFEGSGLTSIALPRTLQKIEYNTFYDC